MKVLISAYACEPGRGSEPGVGWGVVTTVAQQHDVWVITHDIQRPAIAAALSDTPIPNLHFVYASFPSWIRWWEHEGKGIRLHYHLWQLGVYPLMRRLHREIGFDVTHHVTFAKYWAPSLLALLPAPFVWGPVGGGDSIPQSFRSGLGASGRIHERARELARWLGERDPLVRLTARNSRIAIASTRETAQRLGHLKTPEIAVQLQIGLSNDEAATLEDAVADTTACRFVSIGGLLPLKGFHLGLCAFAAASLPDSEYWIIGDGPERARLERLAVSLGVASRVKFWGEIDRASVFEKLKRCHVLVHPSLHDSAGLVVTEAMAARKPVVCLNLGGPAVQVTDETGFRIAAVTPQQAIADMAAAFECLSTDAALRARMGEAGRRRVEENYLWERKSALLEAWYRQAVQVRS